MKRNSILDIRVTLIIFAILPMILSSIILSVVSVNDSRSELRKSTQNSMVSIIEEVGTAFDNMTDNSETTMINFIQSPVVKEVLKHPDDPEAVAAAQEYTVNFYNTLDGWEGIYIADWNSQVITHPAAPVVGRVMREGDRLLELQNAMLSADKVYNVGIIVSPASGQLIMSMYAPVYDENNKPIGYVGAGTFVNNVAVKYSNVSNLGLDTAYIYFVDPAGNVLYHPNEESIGTVTENPAITALLEKVVAGEEIDAKCVDSDYEGTKEYCAYYVGRDDAYVAILAASEAEILSNTKKVTVSTFIIGAVCVLIFASIAIFVSRFVSKPLGVVSKATLKLAEGDVTTKCEVDSHIKEVTNLLNAFDELKAALSNSMSNVKDAAQILSEAIVIVDDKTAENVESISQISNAISEVASTSQAVAEEAQNMAEKAIDLGEKIEDLGDNVKNVYEGTIVIRNANDEATSCMDSVYAGAKQSVAAVEDITRKIRETNVAVGNIEDVLQVIESIASQTDLLSLNASIEAARAGDAGKGFTIVAQEIRTLADSSAKSAQKIKEIVDDVIRLSEATVDISSNVRDVINKQQIDIEKAQAKFAKLSETVEASTVGIDVIKDIASQMESIKVEFANATTELGAISEELGASAQEVAANCQSVSISCADTQASTEEMRAINETMSSAIDYFELG